MKRILVTSDYHCGHDVGLTPPEFNPRYGTGERKNASEQRRVLWDFFADTVERLRPFDAVICNGDLIDGSGEASGGTELIEPDRDVQAEMAAAVINFINAPRVWATYGTAYHTGKAEDFERSILDHVAAPEKRIEAVGFYDVNGCIISARHHCNGGSSPQTRAFGSLGKAVLLNMLWAERDQQPNANIIIRSHVHHAEMITIPGAQRTAFTTPALQGLGSKFGSRRCDGVPVDFGVTLIEIDDSGEFNVEFHISELSLQKAEVVRL